MLPVKGISVVLCCYNSVPRLLRTLEHLALQDIGTDIHYEVILVDNASTDDTAIYAKSIWTALGNNHVPFRVVPEPQPGRAYALRTGIGAANYEFLLCCDDDNWLAPDYVRLAFRTMDSDDRIGALGGHGSLEPEQPAWSKISRFASYYVIGSQAPDNNKWVYGAGCVYRRSALLELERSGWHPIAVGRTKNKLASGEDVECCFALYCLGYKIVADDQLKFRHYVPLARQNENYLLRLRFGLSYAYVMQVGYIMLIDKDKCDIGPKLKTWRTLRLKSLILMTIRFIGQSLLHRRTPGFDERLQWRAHYGEFVALIREHRRLVVHKRLLDRIFK